VDTDRLTDAVVKRLPAPERGNRITYDGLVPGFGARVTAGGHRAFVLTYWNRAGRQRRYTIGSFPDWSVTSAREEARRLKREIDQGGDPLAAVQAERDAPTVNDLIERFLEEHVSRKRPHTQAGYRGIVERHIRPALGRMKVTEVQPADIDALHRRVTKAGRTTQANRVVAVASKLFTLAVDRWKLRADNPVRGVERNVEHGRRRYLAADERKRLLPALAAHCDHQAVAALQLILLTGARGGEVLALRWDQLDLAAGIWTKPGAATKQKRTHVVPLSSPAKQLLADLRKRTNSEWVFPSLDSASGHRVDIRRDWAAICAAAEITGVRIHDLRHDFASQLVSSGASLPLIGSLLGHSKPTTTARYAHLFDDPQRAAVERVGAAIRKAGMS
jgi:integrase